MFAHLSSHRQMTDMMGIRLQAVGVVALFLTVIFFGQVALAGHGDPMKGKAVYLETTCAACHGENGQAAVPGVPSFSGDGSPLAKSEEILIKHVINGFESPGAEMAMPPKGGNPDRTVLDAHNVIAYIRKRFAK